MSSTGPDGATTTGAARTELPADAALVDAARGGDRRAMNALLEANYDRIYAVCRRVTGNDADAADAAQQAMIAIVRALPRFDGRSAFGTWAHRIASLDELRRRRRRPMLIDQDDPQRDVGASSGDDASARLADTDAARPFDLVIERDALDAALAAVPHDFRVPLVLRDVDDLDYAEIAELLGVPVGTVKSRIARGRAQLAAAYRAATGDTA